MHQDAQTANYRCRASAAPKMRYTLVAALLLAVCVSVRGTGRAPIYACTKWCGVGEVCDVIRETERLKSYDVLCINPYGIDNVPGTFMHYASAGTPVRRWRGGEDATPHDFTSEQDMVSEGLPGGPYMCVVNAGDPNVDPSDITTLRVDKEVPQAVVGADHTVIQSMCVNADAVLFATNTTAEEVQMFDEGTACSVFLVRANDTQFHRLDMNALWCSAKRRRISDALVNATATIGSTRARMVRFQDVSFSYAGTGAAWTSESFSVGGVDVTGSTLIDVHAESLTFAFAGAWGYVGTVDVYAGPDSFHTNDSAYQFVHFPLPNSTHPGRLIVHGSSEFDVFNLYDAMRYGDGWGEGDYMLLEHSKETLRDTSPNVRVSLPPPPPCNDDSGRRAVTALIVTASTAGALALLFLAVAMAHRKAQMDQNAAKVPKGAQQTGDTTKESEGNEEDGDGWEARIPVSNAFRPNVGRVQTSIF